MNESYKSEPDGESFTLADLEVRLYRTSDRLQAEATIAYSVLRNLVSAEDYETVEELSDILDLFKKYYILGCLDSTNQQASYIVRLVGCDRRRSSERGESLIGISEIVVASDGSSELKLHFVDLEYQRKRVGRLLAQGIIKEVFTQTHTDRILLFSPKASTNFFIGIGFKIVKEYKEVREFLSEEPTFSSFQLMVLTKSDWLARSE